MSILFQVCAVGWEPNPRMTNYLKRLEKSLQRCGHRVTIFTETGVGTREDSRHTTCEPSLTGHADWCTVNVAGPSHRRLPPDVRGKPLLHRGGHQGKRDEQNWSINVSFEVSEVFRCHESIQSKTLKIQFYTTFILQKNTMYRYLYFAKKY